MTGLGLYQDRARRYLTKDIFVSNANTQAYVDKLSILMEKADRYDEIEKIIKSEGWIMSRFHAIKAVFERALEGIN